MKIYEVYLKADDENSLENAIFVREGFSFFAAILKSFWSLYNKMWINAAVLFLIGVLFILLKKYDILNSGVLVGLELGFLLYVGFSAKEWYCGPLQNKGYKLVAISTGSDELDARKRFLDNYK